MTNKVTNHFPWISKLASIVIVVVDFILLSRLFFVFSSDEFSLSRSLILSTYFWEFVSISLTFYVLVYFIIAHQLKEIRTNLSIGRWKNIDSYGMVSMVNYYRHLSFIHLFSLSNLIFTSISLVGYVILDRSELPSEIGHALTTFPIIGGVMIVLLSVYSLLISALCYQLMNSNIECFLLNGQTQSGESSEI